jgi:hypothetical protein
MKDLRVSVSHLVALSVCVLALAGCGGGASTSPLPAPVTPIPTSSTATLQGQWQIVAHSNVNPASSLLVEANFTQSGSTVTADTSSVMLVDGTPGAFTGLAGECDNGILGDDSVQATVSGQALSFTLTEAGSLGTGTSTGSATISGTQLTGGTYQTPAACGFAADNGSFTGTTIAPFSGTFAGQLLNLTGTTDAVSVTLSQSDYTLNAVGTDAGAPITLTGKVMGATFNVTGMVQGQAREYVGIYDTTSNAFLVYNNQFQFLGTLNAQTSAPPPTPISVSVSPTTASVAPAATQTFTATVANDTAGKGATWTLSCATANGCGSLSAASGASVTYTAPATAPNPPTVTLTATSVSDGSKSVSATITINSAPAGISVSLSQTTATVAVNATTTFTAMVTGDSSNKGVTWTLAGSECGGASCGGLSAATSASGTPITFTAPGALPSPPTVMLTATSVGDTTKSASATITLTAATAGPVNLGAGSFPSAAVDSNGVIDVAWFTEAGIAFARSQNQGATFNTPAVVVPAPAFEPTIAVDGQGDTFILTGNSPTNSLGGNTVVVAHSTDGGNTFTAVTAQQNTYESRLLVQPSGVVDLAYTNSDDNGEDPDNALHETRSTDGGNTFTNYQTLWTAPINSSDVQQWQAALGPQGQIYYTWTEQIDIDCEVHFVNSLDGVAFQPSVLLTNNDICNRDEALVVDPAGNIDAFWGGNGTNFVRSTDQGQTFTTPTVVPISGEPGQLAVGPNGALDSLNEDQPLAFTQSLDNGVTWSTPVSLGLPSTPANFMGPQDAQIAVDPNGKITVVWRDDSNGAAAGDFDVYISTSTDGKNFTPAANISNAVGAFASAPSILISPQGVRFIYWYETSSTNAANVNVFFYAGQ